VLVPIWLGAPRLTWRPDRLIERGPAGFLGRYLVTVKTRVKHGSVSLCGGETEITVLDRMHG